MLFLRYCSEEAASSAADCHYSSFGYPQGSERATEVARGPLPFIVLLFACVYWLLTGISSGKVIKLGDIGATANVLFSTNGRAALFDHLRTEYKRGSDENLELDWGSDVVPFIVVPTMRMPTGRSSSIWDTFGDKEEIRESIGSCVTFRNDRRVMSQHPMSAQIINLNDPLDVANHTVVLEM